MIVRYGEVFYDFSFETFTLTEVTLVRFDPDMHLKPSGVPEIIIKLNLYINPMFTDYQLAGVGSPVVACLANPAKTCGLCIHSSSICEGASTKSLSILRPLSPAHCCFPLTNQ